MLRPVLQIANRQVAQEETKANYMQVLHLQHGTVSSIQCSMTERVYVEVSIVLMGVGEQQDAAQQ